ncbi:MAG: pseudouridine synthase [Candidatus Omnitrophota bacterium]|jgi:23S rRNA pseudouridine2605 synthase
MNLNVFISKSGYCSRRKADVLIKTSKVTVDGKIIDKPYYDVRQNQKVCVDGKDIIQKNQVYFIFNKPKGVVVTCRDIFADKKVTDFFPKEFNGIFPVGRLDKDTTGLIILTNDGDLCYRVTHPSFEVEKEYEALLNGTLSLSDIAKAKKGISDESELLKVKRINILKTDGNRTFCSVVVSEGKKRHLRRIFCALGYFVVALKRVRISNLKLGRLESGRYTSLPQKEIYHLLFGTERLK